MTTISDVHASDRAHSLEMRAAAAELELRALTAPAPIRPAGNTDLIPTHGRRDWVARLTGPSTRYGIDREFLPKRKVGGVWGAPITEPGVYQWSTKEYGSPAPNTGLEIWDGVSWSKFDGDLVDLVKRLRRHSPDWKALVTAIIDHAPTRKLDACTFCPDTLEHFTPDGWAVCDTHHAMMPPVDTDPAAGLEGLEAPTVTA